MKRIDKHHASLQLRPHVKREDWPERQRRIGADISEPRHFKCRDCKSYITKETPGWPTCSNCYSDDVVCTRARLWFHDGVPTQ